MERDFEIDGLNSSDLTKQVVKVSICGYVNKDNTSDQDGNPPTNHWAAFLQLTGPSSVRLDMMPGWGSNGLRGKIELTSKNYPLTNNAIKTLDFTTVGAPTVQQIVDLIIKNGRQKYTFAEEEEGCRYWIYTFAGDLQDAGLISDGSKEETWDAVSKYWKHPTGSEPRTVKEGRWQ